MTLRDDVEYWDAMAERVAAAAVRASRRGNFDWLASAAAGWVAACLLVAAALTLTTLPVEQSDQATQRAQWAEMFAPSDKVGQTLVVRDGPPAIGALLLGPSERVR